MKVKVYIPYVDTDGNKGNIVLDACLNASCLHTCNGRLDIKKIKWKDIQVDCMPENERSNNHDKL